jgi:hypothetical protein
MHVRSPQPIEPSRLSQTPPAEICTSIGMEAKMTTQTVRVRQNYLAIVIAAIACFLFEAGWYTFFMQGWLEGIGRTREWLMSAAGFNPALQYGTALVSAAVIAATISCITQLTGPQTALRGIRVAALLWFGVVLTTISTEYVFEVRTLQILGINTGFWLFGMMVMGAIVGGWKAKAPATQDAKSAALESERVVAGK